MKEAAGNAEKIRIMFEDEARFGRISDPRHCWAPKGTRPVVPLQFVREYTYAYAAVSPCDGILDSLVLPDVNAESMSIFLSIVSERYPDELILMFMDQAGIRQRHWRFQSTSNSSICRPTGLSLTPRNTSGRISGKGGSLILSSKALPPWKTHW